MTFDDQIAVRTMWAECRGEPDAGQKAVAYVLVNRRNSGRWGHSFSSVCIARKQFSCWNDEDVNRVRMLEVREDEPLLLKFHGFLKDAEKGPDPTRGALHYYAPALIGEPTWAKGKPYIQIGGHRFVRGVT